MSENQESPQVPAEGVDEVVGEPQAAAEAAPSPEPAVRKAAWLAMGSVTLALALISRAGIDHGH